MATTALSGPRKIIELDGHPVSEWELDLKAMYMWKGRLWCLSKFGCCICADSDDGAGNATLSYEEDDGDHYHCMKHGPLVEVAYLAERSYTIKIGDVERKGKDRHEDCLLFPDEMGTEHMNSLISEMLDLAESEENEDKDQDE